MIEELQKLEEFYKDNSIYKSLFLCSSEIQDILYQNLLDYDHTVINAKNIEDILDFEDRPHRVILVNIEFWKEYKEMVNKCILPYQNLIILYDLSEYQHILVKRWIRVSSKYITIPESKVLNLDDY